MNYFKKNLFYFGFLTYLVVHVITAFEIQSLRFIPWEPDDHYHYIIKAGNLINCVFSECIGLEDIYQQTNWTPRGLSGEDLESFIWIQEREEHHTILSYHPLYSAVMAGLHLMGVSFETAQLIIDTAGAILFAIAIALFCRNVFGPEPTGLLMFLLSVHYFPYWGTHYISPFNISNVFILLGWSILVSGKRKYFLILIIAILSMTSHSLGIILSAMTLLAAFLFESDKKSIYFWSFAALLSAFMLFFLKFHLNFVESGDISAISSLVKNDILEIIENNLFATSKVTGQFFDRTKWLFAAFIIAVVYLPLIKKKTAYLWIQFYDWFNSCSKEKQRSIKIFSFVFALAFIGSVFEPHCVSVIVRFFVLIGIFVIGILSSFGYWLFTVVKENDSQKKGIIHNTAVSKVGSSFRSDHVRYSYDKLLLFFLLFIFITFFLLNNTWLLFEANRNRIDGGNLIFKKNQVEKLLTISTPQDKVLYNLNSNIEIWSFDDGSYGYMKGVDPWSINPRAEAAAYFYLTYGASKRGAVLSNIVRNTELERDWIDEKIKFLVALSPVSVSTGEGLSLWENDRIGFHFQEDGLPQKVELYIDNPWQEHFILVSGKAEKEIVIQKGWKGWVTIADKNDLSHERSLSITVKRSKLPIIRLRHLFSISTSIFRPHDWVYSEMHVSGIRTDRQSTWWPWDQGVELEVKKRYMGRPTKVTFDKRVLSPIDRCRVEKIIDDEGSTVLADLSCDNPI